MIAKSPGTRPCHDRFAKAGVDAERQMHFYLERAFGGRDDVVVLSDLRLVEGVDAAQIDHLVMHRWGFVIVESKSVCGEIEVNEREEWVRRFGGRAQGMASPVLQARRQGEFLRGIMHENRRELRRKIIGLRQGGFQSCPIDVLVAISDRGRITRRGVEAPEVKKADQVPEAIEEIILRHQKGARPLRGSVVSDDGLWDLNREEMSRIRLFLLGRHRPLRPAPAPPGTACIEPVEAAPMVPAEQGRAAPSRPTPLLPAAPALPAVAPPVCRHCGSGRLEMLFGRSTRPYYFRCADCGRSTQASWVCRGCGEEARIKKSGPTFTRVCKDAACGLEELVFTNGSVGPIGPEAALPGRA